MRDGILRPAPNAKLQRCNPWERCIAACQKGFRGKAPHQELVRLVRGLTLREPDYGATAQDHDAIAKWCGKYGLLGLLPHRALLITLAPRWQYRHPEYEWIEPEEGYELFPVMRTYFRASESWVRADRPWTSSAGPRKKKYGLRIGTRPRPPGPDAENQLVNREVVRNWPEPFAVVQHLARPDIETGPLGQMLSRFFPDVAADEADAFPYPRPCSDDFWCAYGEPVADFIEAALVLRGIVEVLDTRSRGDGYTKRPKSDVRDSLQLLNLLAGSVRSVLWTDRTGTLTEQRASPSLLGLLALMVVRDLDEGRVVRTCFCGAVFSSTRPKAAYCSDRCRRRQKKRNYRARKKNQAEESKRKPHRRKSR